MSGGTITPIPSSPGSGTFLGFVPPLVRTHLSLDRYARILGISPVHFWGGYGHDIWQINRGCDDVWPRHSWQKTDAVSREELALLIRDAENEIARFIGYPVAPEWVSGEVTRYPHFYRKEYVDGGMHNTNGMLRSVNAKWRNVARIGRRATELIDDEVAVAYTDLDGDGFSETATVTVATSLLDESEIKVYFTGAEADPQWEIRWPRRIVISGGNAILTFDSWLFIQPELQAAYPTPDGWNGVDIGSSTLNFVSVVDVYREYTDDTAVSAQLFWENSRDQLLFCSTCGGSGCDACRYSIQDGCLHVRDHENGIVVPSPASYDADSETWIRQAMAVCRAPDMVKMWYQAGAVSDDYLNGYTLDPLDEYWAQTIAMLATSRMERGLCGCGNTVALADHWRTDVAFNGNDTSFLVDFGMLANPFGTKVGELAAYKRCSAFRNRFIDAGVI